MSKKNSLVDDEKLLPKAIVSDILPINGKELFCAVLDDDNHTRVISASAVFEALDRPRKGQNNRVEVDNFQLPPFIASNNLRPFISDDLMEILKYVNEGIQKWIKRFPDDFFIELDKIYNNPKTTSRTRPRYYGGFINQYIYEPIERGYLKEELNKLNIKADGKRRFHQWLTEFGSQQLTLQIGGVLSILKISPNLEKFKEHMRLQQGLSINPSLFDSDYNPSAR